MRSPASSSAGHQALLTASSRDRACSVAHTHSARSSISLRVCKDPGSSPRSATRSPQPRTAIARRRFSQLSRSARGSFQSVWSWRLSPSSTQSSRARCNALRRMLPSRPAYSDRFSCIAIHAEPFGTGMQAAGRNSSAFSAASSGHGEVTTDGSTTRNMTIIVRPTLQQGCRSYWAGCRVFVRTVTRRSGVNAYAGVPFAAGVDEKKRTIIRTDKCLLLT